MEMKKAIIILILAVATFSQANITAVADHGGPERVLDNKYTIILSILPGNEDELKLRFFFNETQTGERLTDLTTRVSINDPEGARILSDMPMEETDGVAEMTYSFPASGLYEILLEFEKDGESEIYRPEKWSVWVPGEEKQWYYMIGLSEMAGLGLLALGIILVLRSYLVNKKERAEKR